jgi:hypothetical protein
MDEESKVVKITDRELTLMEYFDQWLKELVFPGKVENFIEEISGQRDDDEIQREVCFYTKDHCYYINAVERKKDNESYIGCQVSARKERPGEHWIRGNDLPDGPFNKETWNKIVYAIVNYELVLLSSFVKPDEVPDDSA